MRLAAFWDYTNVAEIYVHLLVKFIFNLPNIGSLKIDCNNINSI